MPGTNQIIASFVDISDQKQTENQLRKALDEVEAIQRNTVIGIALFKEDKILRINKRGAEISGYTQEDLVGSDASHFFQNPDNTTPFADDVYTV